MRGYSGGAPMKKLRNESVGMLYFQLRSGFGELFDATGRSSLFDYLGACA